ncbi:hypothetical protein H311_02109 [Anncaliia algerae PRA109]|nr:hypothetical protein H311_02109 [Anncaliia algerae PRA109]
MNSHSLEIKKKKNNWEIHSYTLVYSPDLAKYHPKTRILTSLLEEGFMLDEVDWYSLSPESILNICIKQINRAKIRTLSFNNNILCAFSGVGGDVIPFLRNGFNVTAVDIDYKKIKYLKENCSIIQKEDGIGEVTPIVSDFLKFKTDQRFLLAFVTPPWGGLSYKENNSITESIGIKAIHKQVMKFTDSSIYFLPKNSNYSSLKDILGKCKIMEAKDHRGILVGILTFQGPLFS